MEHVKAKKQRQETRNIEMMFSTTKKKIDIFNLDIHDNNGKFVLTTELSKVDRPELLLLPNPQYDKMKQRYEHLKSVHMDDTYTKQELPVHIILGNGDYTKIKTPTAPLLGQPGEPIAELTKLGWTIMSPGDNTSDCPTFLTRNTSASVDFEQLCSTDVLGVQDVPDGDQNEVLRNFEEQVTQCDDGHYETGLLWKLGHPPFPNNKE